MLCRKAKSLSLLVCCFPKKFKFSSCSIVGAVREPPDKMLIQRPQGRFAKRPYIRKISGFGTSLIFFFLFFVSQTAVAAPWLQDSGAGLVRLNTQVFRSSSYRDVRGDRVSMPTMTDVRFSFDGEYGLGKRVTLFGRLDWLDHNSINGQTVRGSGFSMTEQASNTQLGDAELGLRIMLGDWGRGVLATELVLGLPSGDSNNKYGLQTGDGEFNALTVVSSGYRFERIPLSFWAYVGFNQRTHGFSDEVRMGGEASWTSWRLTLSFFTHATLPLRNGDPRVQGGLGGLYGNNVQVVWLGGRINMRMTDHFDAMFAVEDGEAQKNVPNKMAYHGGIGYRWGN